MAPTSTVVFDLSAVMGENGTHLPPLGANISSKADENIDRVQKDGCRDEKPASAQTPLSMNMNLPVVSQELPPAGLSLSQVSSLAPVGPESVGQDKIRSEDVLDIGDANEKRSDNLDYFGRPRPKNLVRKWPSMMMYLMSQAHDDEWLDVVDRVRTHPQECAIAGINGGMNALHACCVRYPPLSVVQAIVEADQSVVLKRNFNGETPLHIASYSSSEAVQAYLVEKVPEAAEMTDQYGDSPLHFAARAGATYTLMEAFLRAAPKMMSEPNERGVTPFWLLPRSYLEAEDLEEAFDVDGEDYRDDWDSLAVFLRYSYFPAGTKRAQVRDEQGVPLPIHREDYTWVVHAAASTPACPREVLKWLCRMFPEQALRCDEHGYTPLLLAVQQKEMKEPRKWNQMEDGYREHVEVADGELQNEDDRLGEDEAGLYAGDSTFLEEVFNRTCNDAEDDSRNSVTDAVGVKESVVEILLEWSPRSALQADAEGRLPLAHALLSGLGWKTSVAKLITACPRALECQDHITGLYNFQLAAMCSPQLDTVYSLVRALPELLACNYQCHSSEKGRREGDRGMKIQSANATSSQAQNSPALKKRPPEAASTFCSTATLTEEEGCFDSSCKRLKS